MIKVREVIKVRYGSKAIRRQKIKSFSSYAEAFEFATKHNGIVVGNKEK